MTWDPLEKAKNSKTFCIIPWVHQYVGPKGDVKPCCVYDHSMDLGNLKEEESLKNIWNNENTKALRLKFLSGETDPGCTHCTKSPTEKSARQNYNNNYFYKHWTDKIWNWSADAVSSTLPDGTVPEHKLQYMDVRFNNLCNFSCRTCSPHFSTNWIADYKKLHNIPKDYEIKTDLEFQYPGKSEEHAFEEMEPHLKDMKSIYFAGGEPLIQIQHYQTLAKLVEYNNLYCGIVYNTNLSKLRLQEHDVIDYWNKFPNVSVMASIDGSHERAEYWRKGTIWQDIVDNVTRIKESAPHVKFSVSYTLSWPNAINLVHFHKEWVEMGLIGVEDLSINILRGPFYYQLPVLPDWKKQQIEKLYRDHIDWVVANGKNEVKTNILKNKFIEAIDYMNHGEISMEILDKNGQNHDFAGTQESEGDRVLRHFIHLTTKLDKIRNENFFEVFTEYQDLAEYIEEKGLSYFANVQ